MCDDERPCGMCIRRGMGDMCYDGIRKKPKYLEEVPGATVMDISPSICGNNVPQTIQHQEQHQQPQWFVTPGEYSILESIIPRNTTSVRSPYWELQGVRTQSSHDSISRDKDNGLNKPNNQQPLISDTDLLDDVTNCNLLNQQNANLSITPEMGDNDSKAKGQMESAISNKAKQMMESVASKQDHPLIQLVSAIKDEELHLYQWVQLDQHLRHKNDADKILSQIDGLSLFVHGQFEKSNLSKLPIANGASFDSYDDQYEERCLSGTRTDLLQQVLEWGSSSQGKCLFWLNGMAGTGKSTVSRTMAKHFKEKGILGASFFFKRGEGDRGGAKRFIPTIARELSTTIPQMIPGISASITENPDIGGKSLLEQFTRLILQPLCDLDESSRGQWVVVVDALDECDRTTDIKQLLLLPELQNPSSHTLIHLWAWSVLFSPDGRLLASSSYDHTIKLWDTETGVLHHTLDHSNPIQSATFLHDSKLLASGSEDGTVKLWDTISGVSKRTRKGHSALVKCLAFSADGTLLASSSYDHTVRLWDTVTGMLLHTLVHPNSIQNVVFSPDRTLVVTSDPYDNQIKLWSTITGALTHTYDHSGRILRMQFLPDGQLAALGSREHTVEVWHTEAGRGMQHHVLGGHSKAVRSVEFSSDGNSVVSGSADHTVKLWDATAEPGILQHIIEGHSMTVQCVVFSPDGELVASGSNDCTVKLWDRTTRELQCTLEGHSFPVQSVMFSPDGKLIASGSDGHTIKL
ncbi:hypothetical protein SI65_10179 [Aspergillus cristatus]|uniref:Nephrocystin 3-like N-terminal domain-containing protein n=1 Tax=Aspergillus cristatus TaxID=573508 RepID=A0A1E3B0I9_ASPCR|nr:hypothetical protein SI65_10179 [Aspergillus cristatus]